MTYTTKPAYEPSAEEIAARCEEIRRTWDATTEKHRQAWAPPEWMPPRVGMSKRASRTVITEPGDE